MGRGIAIPCVTEYPGLVRFLFGTFAWQADHATSKHQSRVANLHITIDSLIQHLFRSGLICK
jgi:hypothetical protein